MKTVHNLFKITAPIPWQEKVIIRQLVKDDLPNLEWEGEFSHFRQLYVTAYIRQQYGLSVLWLADLPGKGLIGQVFVQLICDRHELADGVRRAYLYSFRVRPQYRSSGLGTRLLAVLENDLIQRKFEILTLNVARDNEDALRMYRRHGFQVVAEEPGVWTYQDHEGHTREVNEPAWRMEKPLKAD